MSKAPPGPNETRLREFREKRAAEAEAAAKKPKLLIPYAGKDKHERGGKDSPNQPKKGKAK